MIYNLDKKLEREIISLAGRCGVKKLILFGSRARGDNRERSDIDLAISGGNVDDFAFAVEELETLLEFDVVNLDEKLSADFQAEIDRDGIILFEEVLEAVRKYAAFVKSLSVLSEADFSKASDEIYRMGIIGQFHLTFELSWKMLLSLLESHGLYKKFDTPRTIIKLAYQYGMINDEETWLEIQQTRNILAHTYSEEESLQAVEKIKASYVKAFLELKNEVEKNWLNESPLDNRRGNDCQQN